MKEGGDIGAFNREFIKTKTFVGSSLQLEPDNSCEAVTNCGEQVANLLPQSGKTILVGIGHAEEETEWTRKLMKKQKRTRKKLRNS